MAVYLCLHPLSKVDRCLEHFDSFYANSQHTILLHFRVNRIVQIDWLFENVLRGLFLVYLLPLVLHRKSLDYRLYLDISNLFLSNWLNL